MSNQSQIQENCSIENTTEPYLIKVRNLSCFCVNCVKGKFETCLNSDYVSVYQSKKITLLKMKQDANIGNETVTKENKEAPKEHIEAMLTKKDKEKAKLLMQRKHYMLIRMKKKTEKQNWKTARKLRRPKYKSKHQS